jgi:UDP-glucose 4-epimerase
MKIFLTGATGFVGSNFMRLALRKNIHVVASRRTPQFSSEVCPENLQWVDGALDEIPATAMIGCTVFVHLAAHGVAPAQATWQDCFYWNVTASLALWLKAAEAGIQRFLICGSGGEYGRSGDHYSPLSPSTPLLPTEPYSSSKAAATMAAIGLSIDKKVEMAILRPFQIYGEGEAEHRFWPSLRRAALQGSDFPMTSGSQIRDFVGVHQVANSFCDGINRLDLRPGVPIIENIGSGCSRTLLDFAEEEWRRFGATGKLIPGALPQRRGEIMSFIPEV